MGEWEDGASFFFVSVCVCVFDPGMIKSEGEAGNDARL